MKLFTKFLPNNGNLRSLSLSYLFMTNIEQKLMMSKEVNTDIEFQYRYVDQVLARFTGTGRHKYLLKTHKQYSSYNRKRQKNV